jgi:hypothetical protein
MTEQLNVRIPTSTEKQIEELRVWTGMTQTQLVIQAIDHLHREYEKKQGGQGNAGTQRS